MTITEPDTLEKPKIARKLAHVEVEVPEDAVRSLLSFIAAMRG